MSGRRFRASSWGAAAIILALVLLILHRFGSFLVFLVIGAGLLWYGRQQREAGAGEGTDERETGRDAAADDAPGASGREGARDDEDPR